MSSFNSLDLFNSGPHRFAAGPQGEQVVPNLTLGGGGAGSTALGPLELAVTVTGRLIADKESDLWALRDTIESQLTDPPTTGDLVDLSGHVWSSMSFVRFEPADRTDRGRTTSLPYTAHFLRFLTPP